jgi:hypothetical protein
MEERPRSRALRLPLLTGAGANSADALDPFAEVEV